MRFALQRNHMFSDMLYTGKIWAAVSYKMLLRYVYIPKYGYASYSHTLQKVSAARTYVYITTIYNKDTFVWYGTYGDLLLATMYFDKLKSTFSPCHEMSRFL